jgi:hypothetical protein
MKDGIEATKEQTDHNQHDHALFTAHLRHLGRLGPCATPLSPSIMTTVGSVTRQIAALEISNPNPRPGTTSSIARPLHTKQPSQPNVAKLLTKFAAPNPYQSSVSNLPPPPPSHVSSQPSVDIGRYDGGLEVENEKRGDVVSGDAATELALDSSLSQYATVGTRIPCSHRHKGPTRPKNGPYTLLIWDGLWEKVRLHGGCILPSAEHQL